MNKRVVGLVCIVIAMIVGGVVLFQQYQPKQVVQEEKAVATTNKVKKTIELGKSVCDIKAKEVMLEYVSDNYVVQRIVHDLYSSSLQVMDRKTNQCEIIMTAADYQGTFGMKDRLIWVEGEQKGEQAYTHITQYDLQTKEKKHIETVKIHEDFLGLGVGRPGWDEKDTISWIEMEKQNNKVTSTWVAYDMGTGEKKKIETLQAVQQGETFVGSFFRDIHVIEDTVLITKDITSADQSKTRLLQIKKKDGFIQEINLSPEDSAPVYIYGDYRVDTHLSGVSVTSISTGSVLFHYSHEDDTIVYSHPAIRGDYFYVKEGGKKIVSFDMKTGERQDVLEAEVVLDLFEYDNQAVVYSRDNDSLFVHVLE